MNAKNTASPVSDLQKSEDRYRSAQAFMQGYATQNLIQNDNIEPIWICSGRFWYIRTYKTEHDHADSIGKEYRLVDVNKRSNSLAFDHSSLAIALASATAQNINPQDLSLDDVQFSLNTLGLSFAAYDQRWQFDAEKKTCTKIQAESAIPLTELQSPDGQWVAFVRGYNLWLREVNSGDERPLTSDGEEFFRYAGKPTAVGFTDDDKVLDVPNLCWSPNSKCVFTVQRDSRKVLTHPIVNYVPKDGSLRPTVDPIKLALSGDENFEEYLFLTINIEAAGSCHVKYPRLTVGQEDAGFCSVSGRAWWADDSRRAYFIDYQGDYRKLAVIEVDTNTGCTREVFEETANTNVNIQPSYMDSSLYRYL